MSARSWLALSVLLFFLGCLFGWAARIHTQGDRYISSLVESHRAEKKFYDTKLDQMISDNKAQRGAKH